VAIADDVADSDESATLGRCGFAGAPLGIACGYPLGPEIPPSERMRLGLGDLAVSISGVVDQA
jgi:hypothetical protein